MNRPAIDIAYWDLEKDELKKLRTLVFVEEQNVSVAI